MHTWIEEFLRNLTQRVIVDRVQSEPVAVASGVPQGTVLGPLLCLCFINDMPLEVSSQIRLFADDCLLYRTIKSNQDHIAFQHDLTSIEQWVAKWGMHFNAKKCYILTVTKQLNPPPFFYQLNNSVLAEVPSSGYLGVTLQNNMKFDEHIDGVVAKANWMLGFCKCNLKHAPSELKELSYYSLVRSLMEYSSAIWDPHLVKHKNSLEAVQWRAARWVKNDYKRDSSVTAMLEDLEWMTLEERTRFARLVLLYKLVHGIVGAPSEDYLTNSDSRTHNSEYTFKHYSAKTEQLKQSFFQEWFLTRTNSQQIPIVPKLLRVLRLD